MQELLKEFVGEALDMIEAVASDLVGWESRPDDRARLDAIFRTVHTIKGSSSFFELPRVTAVAHAAEELLDALRARSASASPQTVADVLLAFDRIRHIVGGIAQRGAEPPGDDAELIARLSACVRSDREEPENLPPDGDRRSAGSTDTANVVPQEWRSVRVPLSLLDEVMSGVSDLVLARNELAGQMRRTGVEPDSLGGFQRLSALLSGVRGSVSQMRMSPLRQLFAPMPRLARQLSDELGKPCRLVVDGGEVEIDREVMEALRDPVVHVLRNALDHGVEAEAVRVAAGKSAVATIRMTARQAGNRILIAVQDDGAGIAEAPVIARAIKAGHVTEAQAKTLTPAQVASLIFLPGLSTAQAVTGISGRGVGMDVVKANIERLGGMVRVESRAGAGMTITFDVPMTLTIISALAVRVGGQEMAIPRSAIAQVLLANGDVATPVDSGGARLVRIDGKLLPRIVIEEHFGLPVEAGEDRAIVVCRATGGRLVAIDVPDMRDQEELVIKPVPPILRDCRSYNGFSLPDNGDPMLVLDIEGLAESALLAEGTAIDFAAGPVGATDDAPVGEQWLCFRPWQGDGIAAVGMQAVERIVEIDSANLSLVGGRPYATIDGQLIAVRAAPDLVSAMPDSERRIVRMLLLRDAQAVLLLPAADILNLERLTVQPAPGMAAHVAGVALMEGRPVELWNSAALLHPASGSATPAGTITLAGDTDSGWAINLVIPALERAGYRVSRLAAGDTRHPDHGLLLHLGGEHDTSDAGDGTIRLATGDSDGLLSLCSALNSRTAAQATEPPVAAPIPYWKGAKQ